MKKETAMRHLIRSSLLKSISFGITYTIIKCGFPLPPIEPSMVVQFLLRYFIPFFIACLLGELLREKMKEK